MLTPRPRRLVSTGSILVDLVLDVPRLPEPGGDVLAQQVLLAAGGGMNVLAAAARLGLPAAYAGPHGTGPFGEQVRQALAREGVAVLLPVTSGEDTGYCLTLVEPDGERTFITVTGADGRVEADAIGTVRPDEGDAVYLSGYDLAYPDSGTVVADWCSRIGRGPFVVLDPGPLVTDIADDLWRQVLPRVDLLTLNDREARALRTLRRHLAPTAVVLHRTGPEGALLHVPGQPESEVPGVAVDVVDTTGAGDTHTGALLAALSRGLGWRTSVEVANHAAALSVTVRGGVSAPTLEELRAAWSSHPL